MLVPLLAAAEQQKSKAREVTVAEAEQLARNAIETECVPWITRAARFKIVFREDGSAREFYVFDTVWDNTSESPSARITVDPRTADVRDGVVCREIKHRSLRRLQAALRHGIGLTDKSYRKLRTPGPMCEPGQWGFDPLIPQRRRPDLAPRDLAKYAELPPIVIDMNALTLEAFQARFRDFGWNTGHSVNWPIQG